jgi:hypothetical protein
LSDTYSISPHILGHPDGRVLCLSTDERHERKGIAVFANKPVAEELAPSGFYAVYCGPEELLDLAEELHAWVVVLLGLEGDLEGSVLPLDVFVGILLGEL